MQLLDWTLLETFQAGALFALAVAYGADGLARRDRMMSWMALGCLLLGLRHAFALAWRGGVATSRFADHAGIVLTALGFLSLCAALTHLFPRHIPTRLVLWVALGLLPDFVRGLLLPLGHPLDPALSYLGDAAYLAACAVMVHTALKAALTGDPMGWRFVAGFLAATFPVVVEVAAIVLFNLKIHLSGFSLLALAITLGSSWQWLATQSQRDRVQETEAESEAWRTLVPGTTFRTDRPSPFMEATFGPSWTDRIRYEGMDHLIARDGTPYRLQRRPLPRHHVLGWVGREEDTRPGLNGFLAGWTVALGMDPSPNAGRIEGWLRAWGADIETWSTIPPREGPYPSVLIWAREPSILAVWREDDLLRRRARWIQVGGPQTEGPHARLELPVTEETLRQALDELLGASREH